MAFFDFLGKDILGNTQAVNDPGGLGISAGVGRTGITWGNLLQAAVNSSSKPGSSAPGITQWLVDPNKSKKSGMQDAVSIIGALYGFGA
jgi:hypothetical protein